jgi:SAM-dependent methyltransferase
MVTIVCPEMLPFVRRPGVRRMNRQPRYVDTHYLDTVQDRIRHDKRRSYEHMNLSTGGSVIEVGCGPGTDTVSLAELVGPNGRVVGVDIDPGMIREANERARVGGVQDTVNHIEADATSLPFDDDDFDAARSERLLQHLEDPATALREMVRVTREGGRIVLMDMDWGSVSIDVPEVDVERRLIRIKADAMQVNGYIGRQLNRLVREAGLIDVQVEPRPIISHDLAFIRFALALDEVESRAVDEGIVSLEEVARWKEGLHAADIAGTFFASGMMVIASGAKPARA